MISTSTSTKTAKPRRAPLTPAERKRAQLDRDRAAGFVQVNVKVPASRAAALREFAHRLMREGASV